MSDFNPCPDSTGLDLFELWESLASGGHFLVAVAGSPADWVLKPGGRAATATLALTGVRINHECPPPKPISFFTEGGNPLARGGVVTTHNPVIRED